MDSLIKAHKSETYKETSTQSHHEPESSTLIVQAAGSICLEPVCLLLMRPKVSFYYF